MSILLIGYANSGKTSVGHRLAQHFQWVCQDTDAMLVQQSAWDSARQAYQSLGEQDFLNKFYKEGLGSLPQWYNIRVVKFCYRNRMRKIGKLEHMISRGILHFQGEKPWSMISRCDSTSALTCLKFSAGLWRSKHPINMNSDVCMEKSWKKWFNNLVN